MVAFIIVVIFVVVVTVIVVVATLLLTIIFVVILIIIAIFTLFNTNIPSLLSAQIAKIYANIDDNTEFSSQIFRSLLIEARPRFKILVL